MSRRIVLLLLLLLCGQFFLDPQSRRNLENLKSFCFSLCLSSQIALTLGTNFSSKTNNSKPELAIYTLGVQEKKTALASFL